MIDTLIDVEAHRCIEPRSRCEDPLCQAEHTTPELDTVSTHSSFLHTKHYVAPCYAMHGALHSSDETTCNEVPEE